MRPPETKYARSGDVRIAYQVVGQGAFDLVFVPGFISNLDLHWEDPGYARLLRRLSSFSRLIHFDKRGTGLSDRIDPAHLPDLETRIDDVRAVLDAAGSGRAALLGASEGAPMAILFAAAHPERTRALVLYGGYARFSTAVQGPEGASRFISEVENDWGTGATLRHFAPSRVGDGDFSAWWARFERLSASPTGAIALTRMNAEIDVRSVLPSIRVPTLVIHRTDDARVNPEAGRYLARHIAGAKLAEIPGRDHPIWTGDVDRVSDAIEEFLTGMRPQPETNRVLAALLVLRMMGPERRRTTLGDQQWLETVERFRDAAGEVLRRFGGTAFGQEPERLLVRFAGPARAVRCAIALRDAGKAAGLRTAQGLHVGEIEMLGDAIGGLVPHITERIAAHAKAGEILASALTVELSAGSGLYFIERDSIAANGVDRSVMLAAVVTERHLEPMPRKAGVPDLGRLSEHTVKLHVANILMKLDLPTRVAAAALAARQPQA